MREKTGIPYYIRNNNRPQEHTIVEDTIFERNGYRLTHWSMGADTAASPERYNKLALYTVEMGEVHIEIKAPEVREIVLRPGDYWMRPPGTLCGYHAYEDSIFSIFEMHRTAALHPHVIVGSVTRIPATLKAEKDEVRRFDILNDEKMTLGLYVLGRNARSKVGGKGYSSMIVNLEGRCALNYNNKTVGLHQAESFLTGPDREAVVLSPAGMKMLVIRAKNEVK